VDAFAAGANTGDSWENAFADLQEALFATAEGDEIWVARGTYRPTIDADRQVSFDLTHSVNLFGGFAGFETDIEQRNPEENATILSGDIGEQGEPSDNSHHVVRVRFEFNEGEISGFTVRGGNADGEGEFALGGGIFNHGILKIVDCIIETNRAQEAGGIYTTNGMEIIDSYIVNNTAFGSRGGGGIVNEAPGIYGPGDLTITNTNVSFNIASGGGGGIVSRGSTNLIHASVIQNSSGEKGAGIFNASEMDIIDSDIRRNVADEDDGGGIYNTGNLEIERTTLFGNRAGRKGGGISNDGSLEIEDSNIEQNSAQHGGGIHNLSTLVVGGTTLARNTANELGGGLFHEESPDEFSSATFTNGTISSNTAATGAGVYSTGDSLLFDHATIALNTATTSSPGAGINSTTPNTWLLHTLAATNTRVSDDGPVADDVSGNFHVDSNYNLIGAGDNANGIAHGVKNNFIGTAATPIEPVLGPLAENGGMAKTHLLLAGSPAIDAGSPQFVLGSGNPEVRTDQRGMARVVDGDGLGGARIDIGSVEAPEGSGPTLIGDLNNDGRVGLRDLVILRNHLELEPPLTLQQGDFNGDSDVDLADMVILLENYGSTFPAPSPAAVVQGSGVGGKGSGVGDRGVREPRGISANRAMVATRRISADAVDRLLSRQSNESQPSATVRASRGRAVAQADRDQSTLAPRATRG
jgi:hypothetical protein